jgi:hypothetical protein
MQQKRHGTTSPDKGNSREERLKAALKANMARRKAQARAREEQKNAEGDETSADDTGNE